MRPTAIFRGLLLGAWLFASVVGCSNSGDVPTYQVTGKVTFPDGSPLHGGWVIFHSADHATAARGTIDEEGMFRLGTYAAADGAVAGLHRVVVVPGKPENYDPDDPVQRQALIMIDRRFSRPDTSGLKYEVDPEGENHFDIEVEARDSN